MSGGWVTITPAQWGELTKPEPYKLVGHDFSRKLSKRSGWPWYCVGCGLVRLKNNETERAIRLGCCWRAHPSMRRG